MKNKQPISGQEISNLTLINRIHVLEGIIFDLKETLKYYADPYSYYGGGHGEGQPSILSENGNQARRVLETYNKSWTEIYEEADKQ